MHSIMQQGFLHDIPMTHSSFAQIELEGSWIHMEVSLQNQLHNVLHLQHKVSEKCQITNFLDISQLSTINQFVYYPTNQSISYPGNKSKRTKSINWSAHVSKRMWSNFQTLSLTPKKLIHICLLPPPNDKASIDGAKELHVKELLKVPNCDCLRRQFIS